MKGMEIRINGKRRCIIGVGPSGVLSSIVRWVNIPVDGKSGRNEFGVSAGGLIVEEKKQTHCMWLNEMLTLGDEVTVKLVETNKPDRPKSKKTKKGGSQ